METAFLPQGGGNGRRGRTMKDRNRIRGYLLGGAIGDALGYPVEFLSRGAVLCFLLRVSLPVIAKGSTPV